MANAADQFAALRVLSAVMPTGLTPFDKRRLLRLAIGSTAGFAISKLMNWPFGVFFAVFPMLLMGMVPVFNRMVACQFIAGVLVNIVELWLLQALFEPYPLLMWMAVTFVFGYHFRFMITTPYLLLWVSGLITLSTVLNLASYSPAQLHDMMVATLLSSSLSVVVAALLYWLIPEPEKPGPPPVVSLSHAQINHRMLMGTILASASYVVFQVLDLRDSLSAQVATMLVLFPMTYSGSVLSCWNRVRGALYGCALALVTQILLYDLIDHLVLVVLAMFITVMIAARLHLAERAGSAMGFGALTTIGILFGQYLQPGADILYASLYRISSVAVALLVMMICAYWLDELLNRFALTRNA